MLTTAWATLTFEEAKAHQDALRNDPAFDPTFDQLIDATGVVSVEISLEQAKLLARQIFFAPTAKRAFVATQPAIFALGRFMETHHELAAGRDQTNVFRDMESALAWLQRGEVSRTGRTSL